MNVKKVISGWFRKPSQVTILRAGLIAGGTLLLIFVDYLFALAGVEFIPRVGFGREVKAIDVAARGHVISAVAGLIGGGVALLTYTLTYRQKQSHFELQRKQEQAQADYDAIAAEYDALSKDFVGKDELSKINAAIGLAAIAKKVDPRKEFKLMVGESIQKTSEFYPWYERVAMQLAAALINYNEPRARDQVRNSIRDIARFDRNSEPQRLLTFLINTLADANRTAFKSFVETFAEGMACQKDEHIDTFARVVAIFEDPAKNRLMLEELQLSKEFRLAFGAQNDKRRLNGELSTPGDPYPDYLTRLRTVSQQLAETRDAISDCVMRDVRNIWKVQELPRSIFEQGFDRTGFERWYEWQNLFLNLIPRLRLSSTFMQGANLECAHLQCAEFDKAQLQHANLDHCYLQGTIFLNAQLRGATLFNAKLQFAFLYRAHLQDVQLDCAILQGANIANANLQRASCYRTDFTGANLFGAQLYGADMSFANLQGANCAEAQLELANLNFSTLSAAEFRLSRLEGATIFDAYLGRTSSKNIVMNLPWGPADLRLFAACNLHGSLEQSERRDVNLIRFLREHLPNGGPKEGEPWPDGLLHEEDYNESTNAEVLDEDADSTE